MNFKQELGELKKEVNDELENFVRRELKDESFYDELKKYVLREGKRLRAVLVLKGFECFKELNPEVVKASLAYELLHASLLVDDDIIDNSDLRRWEPALHKVFAKNSDDEGRNYAILGGMVLQVLSEKSIFSADFDDAVKVKALKHLNRILLETIEGQRQDMVLGAKKLRDVEEKDVLSVMKYKTSKYSIEGPLTIGSILAGENEDFSAFAEPLGLAFQIKDDILGMMGNEEEIGKSVTSDLEEGKKTLLVVKAFEFCKENDRQVLLSLLGRKEVTVNDLEKVRSIVASSGALDYCNNLMSKLVEESVRNIKSKWRESVEGFLKELAYLVVNRKS